MRQDTAAHAAELADLATVRRILAPVLASLELPCVCRVGVVCDRCTLERIIGCPTVEEWKPLLPSAADSADKDAVPSDMDRDFDDCPW